MVLSTQKKITSLLALALTAVLLFSGTFAWQSLNQEALNYVRGGANPGGRLHDDFNNVSLQTNEEGEPLFSTKTYNKDVYVENFTSAADDGVNIYARIRLDEYMEIGKGAGMTVGNEAQSLVQGATLTIRSSWTTHIPGETTFSQYWEWQTGGDTTYMPTFNKNKDSLAADINGTFGAYFADYVDYSAEENATKRAYAIYDNDEDTDDELGSEDVVSLIESGNIPDYADGEVRVALETHTAKSTLTANVITMQEWISGGKQTGSFWVWDTDGWAYWAAPIRPETSTGLLLDQIKRTGNPIGSAGDEWYYGINVVAQFITADDLGSETYRTGFYNEEKGSAPSTNALELLSIIGVDVHGSGTAVQLMSEDEILRAEVGDEYELREAIEQGGKVTLTDDIVLTSTVCVTENTFVYLNGHGITAASDFTGQALFTVADGAWLDFENHGVVRAPADGYVVWVEDRGLLYIWDGTFVGGVGAVYANGGDAVIVDGTFSLQDDESGQLLCQESGSEIIVYGGSFYNFDPSDASGVNLLGDGCAVEAENVGDIIYTVVDAESLPNDIDDIEGGDTGDADETDDTDDEDQDIVNNGAADETPEDGAPADGDATVEPAVPDIADADAPADEEAPMADVILTEE